MKPVITELLDFLRVAQWPYISYTLCIPHLHGFIKRFWCGCFQTWDLTLMCSKAVTRRWWSSGEWPTSWHFKPKRRRKDKIVFLIISHHFTLWVCVSVSIPHWVCLSMHQPVIQYAQNDCTSYRYPLRHQTGDVRPAGFGWYRSWACRQH